MATEHDLENDEVSEVSRFSEADSDQAGHRSAVSPAGRGAERLFRHSRDEPPWCRNTYMDYDDTGTVRSNWARCDRQGLMPNNRLAACSHHTRSSIHHDLR